MRPPIKVSVYMIALTPYSKHYVVWMWVYENAQSASLLVHVYAYIQF